jgi:hypothetical protein
VYCCEYDHSEELEELKDVGSGPHGCSVGRLLSFTVRRQLVAPWTRIFLSIDCLDRYRGGLCIVRKL